MPTLAAALSNLPTVLFWSVILVLIISEMLGYFWRSIRSRFRLYAVTMVLMLGMWWASEFAHHTNLTTPDFQPWTQVFQMSQ